MISSTQAEDSGYSAVGDLSLPMLFPGGVQCGVAKMSLFPPKGQAKVLHPGGTGCDGIVDLGQQLTIVILLPRTSLLGSRLYILWDAIILADSPQLFLCCKCTELPCSLLQDAADEINNLVCGPGNSGQ